MIHFFSENFIFEEPSSFTDPFRYIPHPAVRKAAAEVIELIEGSRELSADFAEGKMLGVLVCKDAESKTVGYIAAFSGNVGGRSIIDGFVPPIYDLLAPDGVFKIKEADISQINTTIKELTSSEEYVSCHERLSQSIRRRDEALAEFRERMAASKAERTRLRNEGLKQEDEQRLIRESQFEKAELKRLKVSLQRDVDIAQKQMNDLLERVNILKKKRASMSDELQDWIFKQYVVHDGTGRESSIADIFAELKLVPPGGTGECAAPKLLEYAYRNGLEPMAMGEFWYGKASETAVRMHGHFYPSCTSKCGPLLGYMMTGLPSQPSNDSTEQYTPEYYVIHEDDQIVVAEKASGVPSVPGLDGRVSLQEMLEKQYGHTIHAVHRLDMDTSGVILFAKTHESAVYLRKQFEDHSIQKTYVARLTPVSGRVYSETTPPSYRWAPPPAARGVARFLNTPSLIPASGALIELPLGADYDERPRQKVDFKQGKPALTEYEIISNNPDGTTDILFHPVTGRTHQLRVHSAHHLGLGRPLVGDLLYGGWSIEYPVYQDEQNKKEAQTTRLHLHALSISFRHPSTGETLTISSKSLCYK